MQESDPDVCLLASLYSLIDHANALNNVFPVARQRNVKFVIGSSLNAGFISGSPRYNYGKTSGTFPAVHREAREAARCGGAVRAPTLRTAALQFSAAPDVAAALVVGALQERKSSQCDLHADNNPARVLGRVETAEPHRAERAPYLQRPDPPWDRYLSR